MRHVITLSTIPPRFEEIGGPLISLLRQKSRPEAIELWIPQHYRRFPGWGGALPQVPEGVTIRRTDEDLGPATKLLPAARARRGQAVELILCDDDRHYARDWAQRLLAGRARRPDDAIAGAGTTLERSGRPTDAARPQPRATCSPHAWKQTAFLWRRRLLALRHGGQARIPLHAPFRTIESAGYVDIFEGYAGVALRPDWFDDQAFDIPPVLWAVDDVWLSGHLERRGIRIWSQPGLNRFRTYHRLQTNEPLYTAVIEGAGRREANQACIDHMRAVYGIWGGVATHST